jgi:hypothetical protein
MAYGPHGTEFPDEGPRQPRASRRPQPYDPFQTRTRDEAADQRRQASDQYWGPADQNNRGRTYGQDQRAGNQQGSDQRGGNQRSGDQRDGNRQGGDQQGSDQYRSDQYGSDQYGSDRRGGDQYRGGRQDRGRYAADPYGGNPYEADAFRTQRLDRADYAGGGYGQTEQYNADPYADTYAAGPDARDPRSRPSRAALRAGATSLLEEDGGDGYGPGPSGRSGGDGDGPDGPAGPTGRRKGKKPVPPHILRRRKIIRRSVLGVFLIFFGYVGITLYPYLTAPGTDRLSARVAEWGRDHHLGWAVTWLENTTYKPPATGGTLNSGQLSQLQGPTASAPPAKAAADVPTNIPPLAAGTIAGEGVWHPITTNAAGDPIVEKAALRPDAQHTSDLAYAVWMNQAALKFSLHPGYQQPGGTWQAPDSIGTTARNGLVATWNGGFKVKPDDALGGFYAEGKTAVPLVNNKAAEVFYKDGTIKIGLWGRDETMTADTVGVRENLSLLVDKSQLNVGPGDGSSAQWGYTIKNSYYIARSGVGMTAKGDIVYVSGGQLSVYTLAKLLQAAGCVYAMELDINPDWVSFMYYNGDPANPAPNKLWDFTQPANRYFEPSDRDFVSVYIR